MCGLRRQLQTLVLRRGGGRTQVADSGRRWRGRPGDGYKDLFVILVSIEGVFVIWAVITKFINEISTRFLKKKPRVLLYGPDGDRRAHRCSQSPSSLGFQIHRSIPVHRRQRPTAQHRTASAAMEDSDLDSAALWAAVDSAAAQASRVRGASGDDDHRGEVLQPARPFKSPRLASASYATPPPPPLPLHPPPDSCLSLRHTRRRGGGQEPACCRREPSPCALGSSQGESHRRRRVLAALPLRGQLQKVPGGSPLGASPSLSHTRARARERTHNPVPVPCAVRPCLRDWFIAVLLSFSYNSQAI